MPEDKEQISKEDRTKLVIIEGVLGQALEMESLDKKMGDIREEMIDLNEVHLSLAAKRKRLEGERDEIRAAFWKTIRHDDKEWFRRMSEAGLQIIYRRVKEPETGASQIQIEAVDGTDEAFKAIKRIFRREDSPDTE